MTGSLSLLLRMRVWALLLLAAIGLQAAEPIRAPLERAPGSAWSSATSDLALVSTRRSEDGVREASPVPSPASHLATQRPHPPLAFTLPLRDAPLPPSQGPPLRAHPALPPDSTAPPRA